MMIQNVEHSSCIADKSTFWKNITVASLKSEPRHDKTNKMSVRPAKTQISLGIHLVWSESSLSAQWVAKDPRFLHAEELWMHKIRKEKNTSHYRILPELKVDRS